MISVDPLLKFKPFSTKLTKGHENELDSEFSDIRKKGALLHYLHKVTNLGLAVVN